MTLKIYRRNISPFRIILNLLIPLVYSLVVYKRLYMHWNKQGQKTDPNEACCKASNECSDYTSMPPVY